MMQKHCHCPAKKDGTRDLLCCSAGWLVCMVSSRFTHTAKANYSATKGEFLAQADALQKTKYFALGSPSSLLAPIICPCSVYWLTGILTPLTTPAWSAWSRRLWAGVSRLSTSEERYFEAQILSRYGVLPIDYLQAQCSTTKPDDPSPAEVASPGCEATQC